MVGWGRAIKKGGNAPPGLICFGLGRLCFDFVQFMPPQIAYH